MAEIIVRKLRLDFGTTDRLDIVAGDRRESAFWIALSLTLPYLEPYLIRTMRTALGSIEDEGLAEEVRRFSAQESHHYRNHIRANEVLRERVSPGCVEALRAIESDLEGDYQRFSRERSLRFNLGYAEGFEAVTCAMAMTWFSLDPRPTFVPEFQALIEWHLAEELEHRTVAFEAYEHVVGSYAYRVARSLRSQLHFMGYVRRLQSALMAEWGERSTGVYVPPNLLSAGWPGRWARTFGPGYSPRRLVMPADVGHVLDRYAA